MYKDEVFSIDELKYVIENLHEDSKRELKLKLGDRFERVLFDVIEKIDSKFLIRLKENKKPVAVFGLSELDSSDGNIAGVFFLPTNELQNGNLFTLFKQSIKIVREWESKYDLVLIDLFKEHTLIEKWLDFLKFKSSNVQNLNFRVYYKGDFNLFINEGYYDD